MVRYINRREKREITFFYRFLELNKQLLWICKCVRSGAYHATIRELRFIFESFIQAYYIDKEHSNSKMECKLEIIKEIDKLIFGSKLIDKTDLEDKNKLRRLYSDLSNYIHSSYEELKSPIKEGSVEPSIIFVYNKGLFDKCYTFTNRVMDAIIFILMSFEKRVMGKIQEDKIMMGFLEKNDCELSLNLLNK